MRILKRISLIIAAVSMVLVVGGCGKKVEEESMNNFNIQYESETAIDKIVYTIDDYEAEITPMHEDKKVKKGYASKMTLGEEVIKVSIEVIDNGEVICKIENETIDLTNGRKADVRIVDGIDSDIDITIVNN